jgi:hypothetical protein
MQLKIRVYNANFFLPGISDHFIITLQPWPKYFKPEPPKLLYCFMPGNEQRAVV